MDESAPGRDWRALLTLARGGESAESLQTGLLDGLRSALGAREVGLYEEAENGRHRLLAGVGDLPREASEAEICAEFDRVDLAGAVVASRPKGASPSDAAGGWMVALAAALEAARLRRRIEEQRFAENYRGVELEALYDVGLAIASTLDLDELAEGVLLRAVFLLDARRGALYLRDSEGYRLDRTLGGTAEERLGFEDPRIEALRAGTAVDDPSPLPGSRHLLSVPIEIDGDMRGLLVVADKESRTGVGPFASRDVRTLRLFANQAAIALENARLHRQALEKERLERELDLAANIQNRLLPTELPDVEGFEVVGWNRPARHVGGDYYDVHRLEPGRMSMVIADVSGKGMPAALLVSTLHSALRLLEDDAALGIELIARLNQHIVESSAANKFITLLLAELDLGTGLLRYVNAGHNPALVRRASGEVEQLASSGLPLGLFGASTYRLDEIAIEPGDLLCLFSDGITEAENPDGEEFGSGRLARLLEAHAEETLAQVMIAIDHEVREFTEGASQIDDQTVVLLRRLAG